MIALQNCSEEEIKEEFGLDSDLMLVVYDYPVHPEVGALAYYTEEDIYERSKPGDKVDLYFMNSSRSDKREFSYADLREVTDREILESRLSYKRGELPASATREFEERRQEIRDRDASEENKEENGSLLALPEPEWATKQRQFEDFVDNRLEMKRFKDYLEDE